MKTHFLCKTLAFITAFAVVLGCLYGIGGLSCSRVSADTPQRGSLPDSVITDGTFEAYAAGTDMKADGLGDNKWYGITDTNLTWPAATVSDKISYAGAKSLRVTARCNAVYRKVTGLKPNTDYVFSYYFQLGTYTNQNSNTMNGAAVLAGDATVDYSGIAGRLAANFPYIKGTGAWVNQNIAFNSGNNSAVYFLFNYTSDVEAESDLYLDNLSLYEAAACQPYFDSTLGTVVASADAGSHSLLLTAMAKTKRHFRGWQKNGTEVSYYNTLRLENVEDVVNYSAIFYDLNLLSDGTFEQYNAGYNLKTDTTDSKWYGQVSGSSDWTGAVVTDKKAYEGSKSLKVYSMYNTIYRKITGLEKNAGYTLGFAYSIEGDTAQNRHYLQTVSVVPTAHTVTYQANRDTGEYLAIKSLNIAEGVCADGGWNTVSVSFNSGESSEIYLCLSYFGANTDMYLDNFHLESNSMAAYSYPSGSFESGSIQGWTPNTNAISITADSAHALSGNFGAKITSTSGAPSVNSEMFTFHKGSYYEWSFLISLKDYSGMTEKNTYGYIDYAIITDKNHSVKAFTYDTEDVAFEYYSTDGTLLHAVRRNATQYWISKNQISTNTVKVVMKFTATENQEACLSFRLNEVGKIYIDDVRLKEEKDLYSVVEDDALSLVGCSVRIPQPNQKQGIRCKTNISKKYLCADNELSLRTVEYGTLALLSTVKGDAPLEVDKDYIYNSQSHKAAKGVAYSLADGKEITYEEHPVSMDYTGVLINIPTTGLQQKYAMRSYVILEDAAKNRFTVYGEECNFSTMDVAKIAYNAKNANGVFIENETVRNHLYNTFLKLDYDRTISIKNNQAALSDNFQGISASVYHCYTFMEDAKNRNYTDEQAAKEMNRLQDSGIKTVRSRFSSGFAWDNAQNGWNWNNDTMKAIYKWANELDKRNINIAFNAGWHLNYFTEGARSATNPKGASIREVSYLFGEGDDRYGESGGLAATGRNNTKSADYEYNTRIKVCAKRYGEWMTQGLLAMKANGINNVKYLIVFTEPSYATAEKPEGDYAAEYITMAEGLNDALCEKGIRSAYKLIGPNQGSVTEVKSPSLLAYYLDYIKANPERKGLLDIVSTHTYANSSTLSIYDETYYHDRSETFFTSFKNLLNTYQYTGEYWCDEFFAYSKVDGNWYTNNGMQLVQLAAGLTTGLNSGIDRVLSWQIFDQLWVNQTNTGGEFMSGVHVCGTCPTFIPYGDYTIGSEVPRVTYYGLNMLTKQLGCESGKSFETTVDDGTGLYAATVQRNDGKTVLLVTNTSKVPCTFMCDAAYAIQNRIERYQYNPLAVTPTTDATAIPSDTFIPQNGNTFYDTVPACSFALYVFESANQ